MDNIQQLAADAGSSMRAAFEVWWASLPAEQRSLFDRQSALFGYLGGIQHGVAITSDALAKVLA